MASASRTAQLVRAGFVDAVFSVGNSSAPVVSRTRDGGSELDENSVISAPASASIPVGFIAAAVVHPTRAALCASLSSAIFSFSSARLVSRAFSAACAAIAPARSAASLSPRARRAEGSTLTHPCTFEEGPTCPRPCPFEEGSTTFTRSFTFEDGPPLTASNAASAWRMADFAFASTTAAKSTTVDHLTAAAPSAGACPGGVSTESLCICSLFLPCCSASSCFLSASLSASSCFLSFMIAFARFLASFEAFFSASALTCLS